MIDTKKVWFITGASKGLGLSLVNKLLEEGHKVIATSREIKDLEDNVAYSGDAFLPLQVNLKHEESVKLSLEYAIKKFERIDVVVNNAGYGHVGTLEESTAQEVQANFDINVFGALHVIRNVMPYLRNQNSGHIINIASVGGCIGNFPGWGVYCATKFAVAGFTEALAEEAKEFNIMATVVYPGYFRTNFLSNDSLVASEKPISAYKKAREIQELHEKTIHGNQPGDPEKAALVLMALAAMGQPPVHLYLGTDAYEMVGTKINSIKKDLEEHKVLTVSTDFN